MGVEWTWLACDDDDRVLVFWTDKRGAYPHVTRTLEEYSAADQAAIGALLRLDLPFEEQPARHFSHPMEGEPDLYVRDGGRGTLMLSDLPPPWRADARRYRLRIGEDSEIGLRHHVPIDEFTAYGWGEAKGMHPSDRARFDAIPTLPGWPKDALEDRIIGLYAAILFQACVCNADGATITIDLPGGPTPPLPVPSGPFAALDWTPILPSSGQLQRILWAHAHPADEFPRQLAPSQLGGPRIFQDGNLAIFGQYDARQILLLQRKLRSAISDAAWRDYVGFLASIVETDGRLHKVRQWILTWERDHPWSGRSTMDDPFAQASRIRVK